MSAAASVNSVSASGNAAAAFARLKALAGEWEGKTSDGLAVRVSYEVVSGGSVLMETLKAADEPAMVTVYHIDGDALVMTHYCSIGNQPHMRAALPATDPNKLRFDFIGGTNLGKPSDGRMQSLEVTFEDKDHTRQNWTWKQGDKQSTTVFRLERKR
jgi:hypothetical protein